MNKLRTLFFLYFEYKSFAIRKYPTPNGGKTCPSKTSRLFGSISTILSYLENKRHSKHVTFIDKNTNYQVRLLEYVNFNV